MSSKFAVSLSLLILLATFAIAIVGLLGFYGTSSTRSSPWVQRQFADWGFTTADLGGFRWGHLAISSFLSLFLEMLMIRWISAEIPVFAYFKNFILIACFLGFGLGCYFSRRRINVVAILGPLVLLTLLLKLPWLPLRTAVQHLPSYIGATSETFMWDMLLVPFQGYKALLSGIALILLIDVLVTLLFVPIGQLVAWYLEEKDARIPGYTVNVLAGLAGLALYTLLCFLDQPPITWFALAGLMIVVLLWNFRPGRLASIGAFAFCLSLLSLGPNRPASELWSPYQKIVLIPHPGTEAPRSWELQTNGSWHQEMINLSPKFVSDHPELFESVPIKFNAYNIPYRFYQNPASVLVLGAGSGNDVAAAVRSGAGRIVAVEIDPLILKLGRELHFEKPYDSPRVHVVLDDARSYIQNSNDKFDVIVFSLLDSHTMASHFSNIRLDNYVYTVEALRSARKLLNADGIFIIKFWVDQPWIAGRLYGLMSDAFGEVPIDLNAVQFNYTSAGRFFIAGSKQRIQAALDDPELRIYLRNDSTVRVEKVTLTTDDWPNFYQRQPGIPVNIMVTASILLLLWVVLLARTGTRLRSLRWHFFFLGAGFMLLETQIVSRMALLFGTTWLVNAVVVGGVLLFIVGANLLVGGMPQLPYLAPYTGIFFSLAVGYFFPVNRLFLLSFWLKPCVAILVLCLPVFFAALVFIRSFAAAGFDSQALGSNLFGALIGGLLELLSGWTGIRSLLLVAALLYLGSYLTLRARQPTGGPLSKGLA
jgi:spermidine synthase